MHAFCMQNACIRNLCSLTEVRFPLHLHHRRMRRAFGFFSSILRSPVGADGSEGGGGAGGSGNGSGNPGGGEQSAGLTEAAVAQVNELISKAFGPRFRSFEEKQTKAFGDLTTALTGQFGTLLEEKLSGFQPSGDGKGSKKDPADPSAAELKQLRRELDETKSQLKAESEAKATERSKARDAMFTRTVDEALQAAGSNAAKAARHFLKSEGLIRFKDDDSEEVVFVDADGDEHKLSRGITEFLKSDEGKRYLPSRGVGGSGDTQQGKNGRGGAAPSSGNPAGPSRADIGNLLLGLHRAPPGQ